MLETIREFATARLEEDAAFNAAARRAHATFFAEFTASQWANLMGEGRERALAALTLELENIRTAWRYWAAEGNLEQLGKFTDSLWLLYDVRGWYHATVELTTDLLPVLSSTVSTPERAREEIILQTSLARALLASKGYTEEVEQAYARALELCTSVGEIPQLFPVLRGLASFYVLRSEFAKGVQIGERILELAERLDDVDMRVEGHLVLGENIGSLDHVHRRVGTFGKGDCGIRSQASTRAASRAGQQSGRCCAHRLGAVSLDDRFSGTRAQTFGRGYRAGAKTRSSLQSELCPVSLWLAQSVVGKCSSRASEWRGR